LMSMLRFLCPEGVPAVRVVPARDETRDGASSRR